MLEAGNSCGKIKTVITGKKGFAFHLKENEIDMFVDAIIEYNLVEYCGDNYILITFLFYYCLICTNLCVQILICLFILFYNVVAWGSLFVLLCWHSIQKHCAVQ